MDFNMMNEDNMALLQDINLILYDERYCMKNLKYLLILVNTIIDNYNECDDVSNTANIIIYYKSIYELLLDELKRNGTGKELVRRSRLSFIEACNSHKLIEEGHTNASADVRASLLICVTYYTMLLHRTDEHTVERYAKENRVINVVE